MYQNEPGSQARRGAVIEFDKPSGRVQLIDPRLLQPEHRAFARSLVETLGARPGVRLAEVDLSSSTLRLEFAPDSFTREIVADILTEAIRKAGSAPRKLAWWKRKSRWLTLTATTTSGALSIQETFEDRTGRTEFKHQAEWTDREPLAPGVSSNVWERAGYLAAAGGTFALSVVGLVVPGIPTVPFLLATSYCLARSSPRLNQRLRRTSFFGPILREWEGHAGLSVRSKMRLIGLTAGIVVVTLILVPLSPIALGVILVISSLSVYGILRMPGLETNEMRQNLPQDDEYFRGNTYHARFA
jgi:uncharacterized membrane protein YbaN (DUF454 family)